jgi:hypothetical protein
VIAPDNFLKNAVETYKVLLIAFIVTLLEGVHATLADEIKKTKPELYKLFGLVGPGYYFFGLFWFSPTYRKYLLNGKLKTELFLYPKLVQLGQLEEVLWYAMWVIIVFVAFI